MGPRSWDRGELQKELERAPEDGASMGPRSWDRGELCETHYYRKRRTGFNGAAVLGPRRGNIPAACINPGGVASMGPRSWDRGEPSIVAIVSPETRVLQWGRGLGTAESPAMCAARFARFALQWGRGLGTAESEPQRPKRTCALSLQWGRGLGTAESRGSAPGTPRAGRFNGAAVLGPRRVRLGKPFLTKAQGQRLRAVPAPTI